VANNGPCNLKDYIAIETALTNYITQDLNRTVGGWEEYAFETGVARADSKFWVNSWHYHTQVGLALVFFGTHQNIHPPQSIEARNPL
jgi:hypothetical protein